MSSSTFTTSWMILFTSLHKAADAVSCQYTYFVIIFTDTMISIIIILDPISYKAIYNLGIWIFHTIKRECHGYLICLLRNASKKIEGELQLLHPTIKGQRTTIPYQTHHLHSLFSLLFRKTGIYIFFRSLPHLHSYCFLFSSSQYKMGNDMHCSKLWWKNSGWIPTRKKSNCISRRLSRYW